MRSHTATASPLAPTPSCASEYGPISAASWDGADHGPPAGRVALMTAQSKWPIQRIHSATAFPPAPTPTFGLFASSVASVAGADHEPPEGRVAVRIAKWSPTALSQTAVATPWSLMATCGG